ncbi:filamentous hemagglutinin N-terminal domain-containing protein [Scytonema sp. NUACC26]|uniref:two-partner secretion domain-containing protein n=1 Tax=Scytonema sp. NUACC26 TaxID=3140176 RepID=UPI0034DBC8AE
MSLMSNRWVLLLGIPISSTFFFSTNYAIAQISPDTTLPNNSTVRLDGATRIIEGGTPANGNLFHSFQEFSVPTGSTAFFNNSVNVQNIISRVTGQSISNIDGLIRTNGSANLFLLNPNGIIFGKNAALNIGGSFFASTATSLNFADGTKFSAAAPQTTSLLTISVPIGLQFGGNAGSIVNQSQSKDGSARAVGLQVQPGKTLALVGGKVSVDGGLLQAADGRIELAGVNGSGTVGLNLDGSNLFLSVPSEVERADVSLTNRASVNVMDKGVGSIAITTRNLDISGGSQISAGIKPGLTKVANETGNISLNATGALKMDGDSLVENVAGTRSNGNTGDINVNANSVELKGGRLKTRTLGSGDAGNINVKANGDIAIANPAYPDPGNRSTLDDKPAIDAGNYSNDSGLNGYGTGRSGNISLETNGSISLIGLGKDLQNNQQNKVISTYNRRGGKGGGDISLKANGSLSLSNAYVVSATFSEVAGGGDISLFGKEGLSLADASRINASSFLSGNAGDIKVKSEGSVIVQNSRIFTHTDPPTNTSVVTNAGNIEINGRSVSLTGGSEVSTVSSRGGGKSGNIQVNAVDKVELNDGFLRSRTLGRGDAGDINIKAGDIFITNPAYIQPGGNPRLEDKPALDASNYRNDSIGNFGFGRSGNISVEASGSISLIGLGTDIENKVISTYNRRGGKGGGGISLKANGSISLDNAYIVSATFSEVTGTRDISLFGKESVSIANNSNINTKSFVSGNSANITIGSQGLVSVQNSRITTEVGLAEAKKNNPNVGNAGDIKISGRSVSITAGAEVTSQSFDGGKPGKIEINATDKVEISGRQLFPNAPNRRTFSPVSILQTNSTTYARDEAGDISIMVPTGTLLVSDAANIRAESGNAFRGGNITVEAKTVELTSGGQLITNASGNGDAGNININKADRLIISGSTPSLNQTSVAANSPTGIFANTASSQGGNITIDVQKLLLMRRNGQISAIAGKNGNGGNITINANNGFIVAVPKENSDVVANAFNGLGGKININATAIFGMILRDRADLVSILGTNEPTKLDPQLLQTNDITAISQTSPNLSGQVNINRPDVDPSGGLVELPINLVDASQQVATSCGDGNQRKSSMIVTGRGGISSSPTEPLMGDAVMANWVTLKAEGENNVTDIRNTTVATQRNTQKVDFVNSSPIVEAQGWVVDTKGNVVLVAIVPSALPHTPLFNPASCSAGSISPFDSY